MTQVAVQEPRAKSVLLDMSDRYGMEPAAFEATLRNTVVPSNCTKEQFAAFLLIAKEYKLNPILKEIYAFPSKGGIQPIVGVDGWANLINSHPAFDGMDFEDHFEDGNLASITCKMYRKDRSHPITATEYLSECKRATEPWQKWPRRMLRHKAMIQAARYAFSFAGIIDPDEAERFAGEFAQDVTPRGNIVPISQRIADQTAPGGASKQTQHREQESNAETVTTPVEAAQVDPAGETPAPDSNSSRAPSPAETDTPATISSPGVSVAGNLSSLPEGWQATYVESMTRVSERPKSLATRRTEALKAIGGTPSDADRLEMEAIEELVKRRNAGELKPEEFKAQLREIMPAGVGA